MEYNVIGARFNKNGKSTHFVVSKVTKRKGPAVSVVSRDELVGLAEKGATFVVLRPKFLGKEPTKVVLSGDTIKTESNDTALDNLTFLPRV